MDYEVIQINEDSWRIEDSDVRFFLLTGTEKALLIDSGMSGKNARDIAEGLTKLPISLLNTHADLDHIGSNGQFAEFYMHPEEEAIYRRWGKPGKIIPIKGQFDEIWPSHADIPIKPDVIKKLHDGARDVLDGRIAGKPTEMHGKSIVEYDLGFCALLCGEFYEKRNPD